MGRQKVGAEGVVGGGWLEGSASVRTGGVEMWRLGER